MNRKWIFPPRRGMQHVPKPQIIVRQHKLRLPFTVLKLSHRRVCGLLGIWLLTGQHPAASPNFRKVHLFPHGQASFAKQPKASRTVRRTAGGDETIASPGWNDIGSQYGKSEGQPIKVSRMYRHQHNLSQLGSSASTTSPRPQRRRRLNPAPEVTSRGQIQCDDWIDRGGQTSAERQLQVSADPAPTGGRKYLTVSTAIPGVRQASLNRCRGHNRTRPCRGAISYRPCCRSPSKIVSRSSSTGIGRLDSLPCGISRCES